MHDLGAAGPAASTTGLHFFDKKPMEPSDHAPADADAKRLWDVTEQLMQDAAAKSDATKGLAAGRSAGKRQAV